jgi:hypothetical protein
LLGAKSLLKADYTYSKDSPDYLPGSYADKKNGSTSYVIHAKEPTYVCWKLDGSHQIRWESRPGGSPRGWSAIVTARETMTSPYRAVATKCFTDCSGLITALLCYANSQHSTLFKDWMNGCSVPEAGCCDPYEGCQKPNPANYYRFFNQSLKDDQGEKEFQKVALDNLMLGDMIAYANTDREKNDSGHMMLVAAIANCDDDPLSRLVAVIDETGSPHSCDTRKIEQNMLNILVVL